LEKKSNHNTRKIDLTLLKCVVATTNAKSKGNNDKKTFQFKNVKWVGAT
jgi:hypothetical protein